MKLRAVVPEHPYGASLGVAGAGRRPRIPRRGALEWHDATAARDPVAGAEHSGVGEPDARRGIGDERRPLRADHREASGIDGVEPAHPRSASILCPRACSSQAARRGRGSRARLLLRTVVGAQGGVSVGACPNDSLRRGYGPGVSPATGEHAVLYRITNTSGIACTLAGYPTVVLFDGAGKVLPFHITRDHSQYVTADPPGPVTLPPGGSAFVLVAKYRCDLGELDVAATIRITRPNQAAPPRSASCIARDRSRDAVLLRRRNQRSGSNGRGFPHPAHRAGDDRALTRGCAPTALRWLTRRATHPLHHPRRGNGFVPERRLRGGGGRRPRRVAGAKVIEPPLATRASGVASARQSPVAAARRCAGGGHPPRPSRGRLVEGADRSLVSRSLCSSPSLFAPSGARHAKRRERPLVLPSREGSIFDRVHVRAGRGGRLRRQCSPGATPRADPTTTRRRRAPPRVPPGRCGVRRPGALASAEALPRPVRAGAPG